MNNTQKSKHDISEVIKDDVLLMFNKKQHQPLHIIQQKQCNLKTAGVFDKQPVLIVIAHQRFNETLSTIVIVVLNIWLALTKQQWCPITRHYLWYYPKKISGYKFISIVNRPMSIKWLFPVTVPSFVFTSSIQCLAKPVSNPHSGFPPISRDGTHKASYRVLPAGD